MLKIKFKISIPKEILDIKSVFVNNGYKLYLVGGSVRDSILGDTIKDYDLATDALPDTVEEMLEKSGYTTIPTGKAFGVINVFTENYQFEIATFRVDQFSEYSDQRRPDSVVFGTIEQDVTRRDLTINALFYDIDTEEIVDIVGGLDDLKNRIIRTVGEPIDRFTEDQLRKIRSVRFSTKLGFKLDEKIVEYLEIDNDLSKVSKERIKDELFKAIKSAKKINHLIYLIDNFDMTKQLFDKLEYTSTLLTSNDPIIVVASLLRNNDVSVVRKKLNDLKYSRDEVKQICFLISLQTLSNTTVYTLKTQQKTALVSDEQIMTFCKTLSLDESLFQKFINFNLTVSGEDVISQYDLKPGKELGEKIRDLELINFYNFIF